MTDLTDPKLLQLRAEEIKRSANQSTDPEEKATLLEIARLYEKLAAHAALSKDQPNS